MGKHRYMRVMINGKKIHTTGGFNKVIENEIDFGKWPDEIGYGCTMEQIRNAVGGRDIIATVVLLFYNRHVNREYRTLERIAIAQYYVHRNPICDMITRTGTYFNLYPNEVQHYRSDEYLRGYIRDDGHLYTYKELGFITPKDRLTLDNSGETHKTELCEAMRRIFSHRYTAFYYDPSQDGSPWDTNELIVKGKYVCSITECRTANTLAELEPPKSRPTMQLIMVVKTEDMDLYGIVNHNPCPEDFD